MTADASLSFLNEKKSHGFVTAWQMVGFVYRDEYYNKDSEDRGIAELIVSKHRAGETGTVRLAFMGEYTHFADLASDMPGSPVPSSSRGDIGFS